MTLDSDRQAISEGHAMGDGVGLGLVERARDAAAREDWQQAYDLVMEADQEGRLAAID
jgi:hypothetical protein